MKISSANETPSSSPTFTVPPAHHLPFGRCSSSSCVASQIENKTLLLFVFSFHFAASQQYALKSTEKYVAGVRKITIIIIFSSKSTANEFDNIETGPARPTTTTAVCVCAAWRNEYETNKSAVNEIEMVWDSEGNLGGFSGRMKKKRLI